MYNRNNIGRIMNLTSFSRFFKVGNKMIEIPPSGMVLQVEQKYEKIGITGEGIPLFQKTWGNTYADFPEDGTIYLVSRLVERLIQRPDFFYTVSLKPNDPFYVSGANICKGLYKTDEGEFNVACD